LANSNKALFTYRMIGVRYGHGECVAEDGSCFLEPDAVLALIPDALCSDPM